MACEHVTIASITHDEYGVDNNTKTAIIFVVGGEENPKSLSNLRGGIPTAHKSAGDESFFSEAESKLCWPEGPSHQPSTLSQRLQEFL